MRVRTQTGRQAPRCGGGARASITTQTDRAWLVGVESNGEGTSTNFVAGPDQTERFDLLGTNQISVDGMGSAYVKPLLVPGVVNPFYVWGANVDGGGDLYAMNPTRRTEPGPTDNPPYSGPPPVHNGDAANLALDPSASWTRLSGVGSLPGIDGLMSAMDTNALTCG